MSSSFILPIFVKIFIPAIFFSQARLDPDPHHDGYMYGGAVAFMSGLLPNKDFFSQYGPLTPITQGEILKLFGPSLLNLRLFTCLLLTLIGYLIFNLTKNQFGLSVAAILSIYWAISAPIFLLPTALPWASVITTLLVMIVIKLCKNLEKNASIISFLLVIGTFYRIQVIMILIFILIYVRKFNINSEKNLIRKLLFSSSVSLLLCISFFSFSGILESFINENLIWAFKNYAPLPTGVNSALIFKRLELFWFPIFGTAFSILYFLSCKVKIIKNLKIKTIVSLAPITIAITILVLVSNQVIVKPSFHNFKYILKYIFLNIQFAGNYAIIFSTLIVCVFYLRQKADLDFQDGLRLVMCLAVLFQLYPQWDQMHVWYLSPIFLALLAPFTKILDFKAISAKLGVLILILSVSLLPNFLNNLNLHRVGFNNKALIGMLGEPKHSNGLNSTLNLLQYASVDGKFFFDCPHGLYAGAGGRFISSSGSYVNFAPDSSRNKLNSNKIFVCNQSLESISTYEKFNNLQIIWKIRIGPDTFNALFLRR